ncbi:hypothetical protein HII31_02878 [Pseudocercospora fuligena]|uniref:Uncharacterized protein n=1 Tax=Pseudocercospora fuligena TaxID=685502 RepID=A0A8H6RRT0_9PEZI|nr:hypothetical protein HII31_02878 [Pseudocercospora fuligena]
MSEQKRRKSVKETVRETVAKLRKRPHVTADQKLQVQIDSMNTQASELDAQCQVLKSKAGVFTARAQSTPMPSSPPPDREPLFERDPKAPPSQYDAQVKAYGILIGEWHLYEKEVKTFAKKLDRFEETVESMKRKHVEPTKAVGKPEHEFIGLDNALFKLKEQRGELSRAVATVPLPAEK